MSEEMWNSLELRDASDFLASRGWTQRAWSDGDGVCLMEAVYEAYAAHQTPEEQRKRINAALRQALPEAAQARGLIAWNDGAGRSLGSVLDLFRRADGSL